MLYDNEKLRFMDSKGTYHKKQENKIHINSQEFFMRETINGNINRIPEKESKISKILSAFNGFLKINS
jgi:hypothetical protein